MADQSFRVWKLTSREQTPYGQPYAVNAETHEGAASQIAMELERGGFYRVDLPPTSLRAGDARIIRVVPVTTYEACEEAASLVLASDNGERG